MAIKFNGREYESPAEMPADVRNAYETMLEAFADRNQNGIPDVFEGGGAMTHDEVVLQSESRIVINGQTYGSAEEMPPELRRTYEQALKAAGLSLSGGAGQNRPTITVEAQAASRPVIRSAEEKPFNRLQLVVLLVVAAGVLGYLLARWLQ